MKYTTFRTKDYTIKGFVIDGEIITEIYYKNRCIFTKTFKERFTEINSAIKESATIVFKTQEKKVKDTLIERNGWERMTAKRTAKLSETIEALQVFQLSEFVDRLDKII
ncbi:MAG: hypothetical protein ACRCX2_38575 [Paraclostridium sp.]